MSNQDKLEEWIDELDEWLEEWVDNSIDKETENNICEALEAVNHQQLWVDSVDSVSLEQALLCWRIVERVKASGFPEDLCC